MRATRKKVIKTVYKDENSDEEDGDFSDSGSEAKISVPSSSEEDEIESEHSSAEEFDQKSKTKISSRKCPPKKTKFSKSIVNKINKQKSNEDENNDKPPAIFSIKDLTEADKLLPPILNLSESDSSDDESPKTTNKSNSTSFQASTQNNDSDNEFNAEYKDVWSNNMQVQDDSEEIAKKTFMELEKHKSKVEETKATLLNYMLKMKDKESDVKDLLALGEELPTTEVATVSKKPKFRKRKDDSDSEMEDWEEVKETKAIPQQGLQLFVEFPDVACRKSKKVDVEMMMRRKINRVKKEYQVYMHKVHVLCWLGHGNYISRVLNDQELLAAALSLVPAKECYPGERVDMKYVEQITAWYKDKLTLKQDKNEDKFKPKAPPLKTILLDLIQRKMVTAKKYLVFIFVSMLRALGLQCRIMFNFVTLPLKPPTSELCSLSTKLKDEKSPDKTKRTPEATKSKIGTIKSPINKTNASTQKKDNKREPKASTSKAKLRTQKIAQVDGNYDICFSSDDEDMEVDVNNYQHFNYNYENIMQVDGNDDALTTRKTRSIKRSKAKEKLEEEELEENVSPLKIPRKSSRNSPKPTIKTEADKDLDIGNKKPQRGKTIIDTENKCETSNNIPKPTNKEPSKSLTRRQKTKLENSNNVESLQEKSTAENRSGTAKNRETKITMNAKSSNHVSEDKISVPKISVTDENKKDVASKYFEDTKPVEKQSRLSRKRSHTANPSTSKSTNQIQVKEQNIKAKGRTKSTPGTTIEKSKYFPNDKSKQNTLKKPVRKAKESLEDKDRVSHRDLAKGQKGKDVTGDLVDIIKSRIKEAKSEAKKRLVKDKIKRESEEDSDYLPVEDPKSRNSDSEDNFKPTKISPKPSANRRIDCRVLSSPTIEEPSKKNKVDVWCEIFVEELEQWLSVDVIKGKIHSTGDLYNNATHPVCYVVGWDNNNYLKDLTRKYVPQYNTVTRKLRAESAWWDTAVRPHLGPKTARDREEDEYLDRMQLEAPLPKSITEYKNHPLYALKRHLLKFEAIYPADAAVLGFVRGEPVHARACVHTCRSRDTWLKEAKVVKLGETPYKVVKARPKWDKLSNKLITDKPLEVFGPWQVQEYEPPVAENGIVPRNAYGNVELFKACMLPKGTAHIKLPGLNRVAKKLNIDCAPAMTGFDFNGGWSHPVYDGFVVCEEFEEIIREAWQKDQEEQERREIEKTELRVYGNWKRLIKGLLIRERLKDKYGFKEPTTSGVTKGKSKGPKLVAKKKM